MGRRPRAVYATGGARFGRTNFTAPAGAGDLERTNALQGEAARSTRGPGRKAKPARGEVGTSTV